MALSFQTFDTLVQRTAAAVQGACSSLVNLSPGSVLRSILEANASVALWLQWLLLLLMNRQRLATCTGTDVDTFVNDYAMYRLPAVAATGAVTFSRFTPTNAAVVPVGTNVITSDGTQPFAVVANSTNSYWNGTGYTIPAATASAILPVQAVNAATATNVLAGTVTLLGTAVSGVDTVSNALAMSGGADAESDAACIARFPLYIAALARATPAAVAAAIAGVQQGLTYFVAANVSTIGAYQPGNFVVTVDDGTGFPGSTLQAAVYAAVDAVRPIGSTFAVQPPTVLSAPVVLTLTVAAGIVKANVTGTVASAISTFINALPVGAALPYSIIAKLAYDALPSGQVTNVSATTLNGGTADIVPGTSGVVKTSSVTVN
jgi:uncharacterized phage protein gp47/JayE